MGRRRERRVTGPWPMGPEGAALPPDLDTPLSEIADALDDLRAWLADWHRQVICHRQPDAHLSTDGGECRCAYGRWLARRLERPLGSEQPILARLSELHRAMHGHGDRILAAVASGQAVEPDAYDAFAGAFRDLDELTLDLERDWREQLVEIDPLTGLRNRRGLVQELQAERERAARSGDAVSVAMLDIDRFKVINDRYGHLTGDAVLRALTRHVLSALRTYDRAYRLGGDEFILCFPAAPVEAAAAILERLRANLPPVSRRGAAVSFTVSAGVADLGSGAHVRSALDNADAALYTAKRAGRDRVAVWTADAAEEKRRS